MKFQILISALLFGSAVAQNGYVFPTATGNLNLPTTPSSNLIPTHTSNGDKVVVPNFPRANLFSLQRGSTDSRQTNLNTWNTLRGAQSQLSNPVQTIQSLFLRLPSKSQLRKLADDGDVAGIQKTLQVIASDDSIPCNTKTSYLLDFLSIVKNEIQQKNLAADQLQFIIDDAKAQIKRLQGEIAWVKKNRDALGLPELNKKVNELVSQIRVLYDKINTVRSQIPPQEARITGYHRQIEILTKQNEQSQNRISNDNLKLVQTNNLIKDIQNQLKDARDLQANLTASIAATRAQINDNNVKIGNLRNTIDEINAKIKSLKDLIDTLQKNANTLEIDVQRARTDLSVAQAKDKTYSDQIREFQSKISSLQPRLVDDDLRKIRDLINNLNNSVPEIQNQINRQYYYCYGAGKVSTITTGSVTVYVVRGEAFGEYIQNVYGQSFSTGLRSNDDYRLQVIDPFSPVWTSKFGLPSVSNGSDNFSCFNGHQAEAGLGTVSSVTNNGIVIKDANGKQVRLTVGSCSRVEATSQLPQAGQNVAWRGRRSNGGDYQVYSATCW